MRRAVNRPLISARVEARRHVQELDQELDRLSSHHASAHSGTLRSRDRGPDGWINRGSVVAIDFGTEHLGNVLAELALGKVRARINDLAGADDVALVRALDLAAQLDAIDHCPACDFGKAQAMCQGFVAAVDKIERAGGGAVREPRTGVRATMATRLTRGAVRVLPVGSRRRYREEFDAELYDLAAAGAPRHAQVMYALRLIDRAWVLRAELRAAALRGKVARP